MFLAVAEPPALPRDPLCMLPYLESPTQRNSWGEARVVESSRQRSPSERLARVSSALKIWTACDISRIWAPTLTSQGSFKACREAMRYRTGPALWMWDRNWKWKSFHFNAPVVWLEATATAFTFLGLSFFICYVKNFKSESRFFLRHDA